MQELVEQERAFWAAAGDGDFYREHFADDGVCVFPMGPLDKDATIRAIEQADPWVEVSLQDVRVIALGGDTAAVVYLATARRAAQQTAYRARVTSVYARRDARWLLAVHQQTPVS